MPRRIPASNDQLLRSSPEDEWILNYPGSPPRWSYTKTVRGSQDLTISEGHQASLLGKTQRDIGGSFQVTRRYYSEYSTLGTNVDFSYNANPFSSGNHFRGGQYAKWDNASNVHFPSITPYLASELDSFGTTAIARILPTNPLSGLSQFIGEAREGLPALVGSDLRGRSQRAKNAGGEYLNVEFGWKPLVNDLKSFNNVARNADAEIAKYVRNSGKRLKRRYEYPLLHGQTITTQANQSPKPVLNTPYYNTYLGTLTINQTWSVKRWFSGCFTYYLPPYIVNGDNTERDRRIAAKLYGARITPETVWDLAPWTWAADWVGNLGDVIHNVSAFRNDGLTMPYGYMMTEQTSSVEYILSGIQYKSYPGTQTFVQRFSTVLKQRRKASPYGFGLNPAAFSNRRLAILAALGISKSGSQL